MDFYLNTCRTMKSAAICIVNQYEGHVDLFIRIATMLSGVNGLRGIYNNIVVYPVSWYNTCVIFL